MKQGKVPRLAVCRGLGFAQLPDILSELTQLEQRLVSPRHVFMAIRSLGKGRQLGLHGLVVNVPIDVDTTINHLPRTFEQSQTIQLQLYRKMCYKKPYMYETIRPHSVLMAAKYLIGRDLFQSEGIVLLDKWINEYINESGKVDFIVNPKDKVDIMEESLDEMDQLFKEIEAWDETKDELPINPGSLDTLLLSRNDTVMKIAPGEGKIPLSLLMDERCEELAFPCVYGGVKRNIPKDISVGQLAKSDILRVDRRCSSNIPLLFLKYKRIEDDHLNNAVNVCLRKVKGATGKSITASDVLNEENLQGIIDRNEGFQFMKKVRPTPAFWEQKKKELMAMIRQFGCPTFFLTLSAAETQWPELLNILSYLIDGKELFEQQIVELEWHKRAELIRKDPVTCARYFDYRSRKLLKILRSKVSPLGVLSDYYMRVEFQQRGSPHIHALLWIKGAPIFGQDSTGEVEDFIANRISCAKPEENELLCDEVIIIIIVLLLLIIKCITT